MKYDILLKLFIYSWHCVVYTDMQMLISLKKKIISIYCCIHENKLKRFSGFLCALSDLPLLTVLANTP